MSAANNTVLRPRWAYCDRALYWDFLMRHEPLLLKNPRMALQVKNVARLSDAQRQAVTLRAQAISRGEVGALP